MATHFSTIGFKTENKDDILSLAKTAYEKGEKIKSKNGTYVSFALDCGVEIWDSFNEKGDFLTLFPSFKGESSRKVNIVESIDHVRSLEGSFLAWSELGSTEYPFMFDVPGFDNLPNYTLPKICNIQLTAFAHNIKCSDNENEFYGDGKKPQLAKESFIPSGLFLPGGKKRDVKVSEGIFAGKVLKWKELTNDFTGNPFIWMLVDTLGGEVDVLCDPTLLNKKPVKGGYILGTFWLTGRILNQ